MAKSKKTAKQAISYAKADKLEKKAEKMEKASMKACKKGTKAK